LFLLFLVLVGIFVVSQGLPQRLGEAPDVGGGGGGGRGGRGGEAGPEAAEAPARGGRRRRRSGGGRRRGTRARARSCCSS